MDLNELRIDDTLGSEGVWIPYGEDVEFLIASAESPAYKKAVAKHTKRKNPRKVRNDAATMDAILIESMAEALLLNFKGITDGGKPLKNTLENRKKVLGTSAELRNYIASEAQDVANFQQEGESADADDLKSDA